MNCRGNQFQPITLLNVCWLNQIAIRPINKWHSLANDRQKVFDLPEVIHSDILGQVWTVIPDACRIDIKYNLFSAMVCVTFIQLSCIVQSHHITLLYSFVYRSSVKCTNWTDMLFLLKKHHHARLMLLLRARNCGPVRKILMNGWILIPSMLAISYIALHSSIPIFFPCIYVDNDILLLLL